MLHKIALLLVIVGAVHLGLVAMAGVDLISVIFGTVGHMIHVIVGLSGIYLLLVNYTTLLKKAA